MKAITIYEVVQKLIGPVDAVGASHIDVQRLENLKALTELVDRLILVIHNAAGTANRQEASMRTIGQHAREFLYDLKKEL